MNRVEKQKLDNIIESTETIQRLANIITPNNTLVARRLRAIIADAEVIKQLAKSIQVE